jgi:hypothetical protein
LVKEKADLKVLLRLPDAATTEHVPAVFAALKLALARKFPRQNSPRIASFSLGLSLSSSSVGNGSSERERERGGREKKRKGEDGRQVAGRRRMREIHKPGRRPPPSITPIITFFGG